jgi:hypothetical protein
MERSASRGLGSIAARAVETQGRQRVHLRVNGGNPRLQRIEAIEWRDLARSQQGDNIAGGLADKFLHLTSRKNWLLPLGVDQRYNAPEFQANPLTGDPT